MRSESSWLKLAENVAGRPHAARRAFLAQTVNIDRLSVVRHTKAMGSLIAFSCVLLMVFCGGPVRCGKHDGDDPSAAVYTANSGTYVSTYDHLDVNRLLKNDKLVSAYIRCFLGEGPCTAEGKQVKGIPTRANTSLSTQQY